jgi:5,10-methylene-tetrahydrofolate dehydrogenase/methenyl tetrahydrofolate cyclohydrolase
MHAVTSRQVAAFARKLVSKYELDLHGLTVLTEAASGAYLWNPLIAVMANADRVVTFCKSTRYGTAEEIEAAMHASYASLGASGAYEFVTELKPSVLACADVVTNSGHLRPFTRERIAAMKPTAVLALMWEPWEIRPGEIDLDAAREHGVLVMGTNEHAPPCDMRPYSALTALHLMMAHKAMIADDRVVVIGEQPTLAAPIVEGLRSLGVACRSVDTSAPADEQRRAIAWATYILVAEHAFQGEIIGWNAPISPSDVAAADVTSVGVIAGTVDRVALEENGVSVYPSVLAGPGYMSYLPWELGPYPVMDLFAAGIKVGQQMARARLGGMTVREAALHAMATSPALDLEGKWSWI